MPEQSLGPAVFTVDMVRELFLHMEWADATVWRAALTLNGSPIDPELRRLLLHVYSVQRAFLHVWTSQPVTFSEEDEFTTLGLLHARVQPYYGEARAFLESRDAGHFAQPVVMPWIVEYETQTGRQFAKPSLGETAFQVTSHSTYHRGQVNTRLRALGVEPPLVDFIAWVWFGKPAADWS